VARYPTSGAGWLVLGECLTVSCHFSAASSALQKARKHIPADKRHFALQSTGHLWKAQGRLRRAEHWYRKALELGSKDGSLIYLAVCVQIQGRVNEALALFRRAARLKNDSTDEAWYNIGSILLYRGRYHDAIKAFDRAIDIDPKYQVAIKKRKEARLLLSSRAA
jgi:tetratricopeptide (TPR) repeat protein